MFRADLLVARCFLASAAVSGALAQVAPTNVCAAANSVSDKIKAQSLKAACELSTGQSFLKAGLWPEAAAHCSTAATLDPLDPEATRCLAVAGESAWKEWSIAMNARLTSVSNIAKKSTDSALKELDKLRTDAHQRPAIGSGSGVGLDFDLKLAELTTRLTAKHDSEWPRSLPNSLGIADWVPGVVSALGRIALFTVAVLTTGFLAYLVRLSIGYRYWRSFGFPVTWRVVTIADDTKQGAAGALMDALNVRYNPLFSPLFTSSFLAFPPGLGTPIEGDRKPLVIRNFMIDGSKENSVRPYFSTWIEDLLRSEFEQHKFRQVDAFEDMNLKLGVLEASFGSILSNLQAWWYKGRPSITGSVQIEDVDEKKFASIRLTAHYGDEDKLIPQTASPGQNPDKLALRQVFSQEQTISVFASTQVDTNADAVALASQRAAFRLLYRLQKSPDEGNLAIAASCFRQGVRLLNVSL